ncbi:MAG: J domain-containing protein [Deltaproteobacteria bacterium]|jgi:hypothetical protein|nr:J domain-containing protein [Deltaproteobacteria bacterium]
MNLTFIFVLLSLIVIAIISFLIYTLYQIYMQDKVSGKTWVSGYTRVQPHVVDEYSRLLSFFKLTDSATEEDIKEAYRRYVRENHPDMTNADPEKIRKFQEVKTIYERIMDMKRNSFIGRGQAM